MSPTLALTVGYTSLLVYPLFVVFVYLTCAVVVEVKLVTIVVYEKLLRTTDDCVWHVDSSFHGRFTIDVEFLDLKICPLNVCFSDFSFN